MLFPFDIDITILTCVFFVYYALTSDNITGIVFDHVIYLWNLFVLDFLSRLVRRYILSRPFDLSARMSLYRRQNIVQEMLLFIFVKYSKYSKAEFYNLNEKKIKIKKAITKNKWIKKIRFYYS